MAIMRQQIRTGQ